MDNRAVKIWCSILGEEMASIYRCCIFFSYIHTQEKKYYRPSVRADDFWAFTNHSFALTLSKFGRFGEKLGNCTLLCLNTSVKSPYAMNSNIIHGEFLSSKSNKQHYDYYCCFHYKCRVENHLII